MERASNHPLCDEYYVRGRAASAWKRAPLPGLRHQHVGRGPTIKRGLRDHRRRAARCPPRTERDRERHIADRPVLEPARLQRRRSHHRLPDRSLPGWRDDLERTSREHRLDGHQLCTPDPPPRRHAALQGVRDQPRRRRPCFQRSIRHHRRHDARRAAESHRGRQRHLPDRLGVERPRLRQWLPGHRLQNRRGAERGRRVDHSGAKHGIDVHRIQPRQPRPGHPALLPGPGHQRRGDGTTLERGGRHHRCDRARRAHKPRSHGHVDHPHRPDVERARLRRRLSRHRLRNRSLGRRAVGLDRPGDLDGGPLRRHGPAGNDTPLPCARGQRRRRGSTLKRGGRHDRRSKGKSQPAKPEHPALRCGRNDGEHGVGHHRPGRWRGDQR